jgi:hypothetical protein
VEVLRPQDSIDTTIVVVTAMLIVIAVALSDGEAARFVRESPVAASLPAWARTVGDLLRRAEIDLKVFLAVATLAAGLVVLSRPTLLRTRAWPGPGHSALAVGALAEIFMIVWHFHLISQGRYWLSRNYAYLLVTGTVARVSFRTTGAILGTWMVLALSGRWRRRPDFLDRLGCLLGYGWIGIMVVEHLAPRFWLP